jgi:hypothetical protein
MIILRISKGVKIFEKKEETIPSPPSTVQREKNIDPIDPVDPIASVDVPRDMAVGRERPTWDQQTLLEVEGHATPCDTF